MSSENQTRAQRMAFFLNFLEEQPEIDDIKDTLLYVELYANQTPELSNRIRIARAGRHD